MTAHQLSTTLTRLSEQIARLESGKQKSTTTYSSGFSQIDALLLDGGFQAGTLVEWLQVDRAGGAMSLGLVAAREACRQQNGQKICVVVEQRRMFYPPAAAAWGIPANQLVIVRPQSDRDEIWALTQILRCRHVAAVLCSPRRLSAFDFRRLQLAAEAGGTLGCFIRSEKVCNQPSWTKVRLLVQPCVSSANPMNEGREILVHVLDSRARKARLKVKG